MRKASGQNFLHAIALIVMLAGSVASLFFMFNTGRNQRSILLIILFTGWVLSPFVALLVANKISKLWSMRINILLYWLMIILTIFSVIAYSGMITLSAMKPASRFLIIPFISWLLIGIFILINRPRLRRRSI